MFRDIVIWSLRHVVCESVGTRLSTETPRIPHLLRGPVPGATFGTTRPRMHPGRSRKRLPGVGSPLGAAAGGRPEVPPRPGPRGVASFREPGDARGPGLLLVPADVRALRGGSLDHVGLLYLFRTEKEQVPRYNPPAALRGPPRPSAAGGGGGLSRGAVTEAASLRCKPRVYSATLVGTAVGSSSL